MTENIIRPSGESRPIIPDITQIRSTFRCSSSSRNANNSQAVRPSLSSFQQTSFVTFPARISASNCFQAVTLRFVAPPAMIAVVVAISGENFEDCDNVIKRLGSCCHAGTARTEYPRPRSSDRSGDTRDHAPNGEC